MKQLLVIKSVQSRVRYNETELKRIIDKKAGNGWWHFKKPFQSIMVADGFATMPTFSVTVPLSGTIEIASLAAKGKVVLLQVHTSTRFFVTCVERKNHHCIPALAVSLS
ncbi:MAG TPA: hypothetical protein VFT06_07895 [Flavisolibacter sp.]|nr:hypothetical protein [Flavisolibacter sp.]